MGALLGRLTANLAKDSIFILDGGFHGLETGAGDAQSPKTDHLLAEDSQEYKVFRLFRTRADICQN